MLTYKKPALEVQDAIRSMCNVLYGNQNAGHRNHTARKRQPDKI